MSNVVRLALPAPEIESLRGYRSIYALCDVSKDNTLKAQYYASVLIGGPAPVWGIWTVQGRFVRFAGSRFQIEKAYKKLVWRRKMATWACTDYEDKTISQRRQELESLYGQKVGEAP